MPACVHGSHAQVLMQAVAGCGTGMLRTVCSTTWPRHPGWVRLHPFSYLRACLLTSFCSLPGLLKEARPNGWNSVPCLPLLLHCPQVVAWVVMLLLSLVRSLGWFFEA